MIVPEFSDYIYETIYPGWGETEARADWSEQGANKWADYTGGGGQFDYTIPQEEALGTVTPNYDVPDYGNYPSAEDYIKAVTSTIPSLPEQYTEKHPFSFDEEAAKEVATAQYSPYYEEMLGDYMADIETTRKRVGEDETRMLSEMEAQKDYYQETQSTRHERLLRDIKEGYSDRGLYFSGERRRTEGESQTDYQRQLEDYMRGYQYETGGVKTEAERRREDMAKQAERRQRDIGREKQTAIAGGVQQMRGESLDEYLYGMGKYYQNPDWGNINVTDYLSQ